MTIAELLKYRLHNQHITHQKFASPEELVTYLGAVQAQDYASAKWALGLRLKNNTDKDIDNALANGSIIRTHIMRPTWHLVAPQDIRWLLELTAPRIKMLAAYQYRRLELDDKLFAKSNKVLVKALQGGKHLERGELVAVFNKAKIPTNEQRFIHIMMRAELDAVVCSGPRVGKQFSYCLLDERVPQAASIHKDEAISRLAIRYFTSHGPATVKDFMWWSGLTMSDAKAGQDMVKKDLVQAKIGDIVYWMHKNLPEIKPGRQEVYLLPAYDEYLISYADRSAALASPHSPFVATKNGIFNPVVVINGKVVATWKRTIKKDKIEMTIDPFEKLSAANINSINSATNKYAKFAELPVMLLY